MPTTTAEFGIRTGYTKDYDVRYTEDDYCSPLKYRFPEDSLETYFDRKSVSSLNAYQIGIGRPTLVGWTSLINTNVIIGKQENLAVIEERIQSLMDEDEEFKPSIYAYSKALSVAYEIADGYNGQFPRAAIAVGEDNGVYFYWKQRLAIFELRIPANPSNNFRVYINTNADEPSYMEYVSNASEIRNLLMVFWQITKS
jgi:hypothetical protein